MISLKPLHPHFVAEAIGVDLRSPLSVKDISFIEEAMDRHAVLVWHGQPFSEDEQVAFARQFGTLDIGLRKAYGGGNRFGHAELIDISNVDMGGEVTGRAHPKTISNLANQLWHSDSSFQQPAAKYSMLSAVVLPERGGETEFCDLRAAYDALPEDLKREIADLKSEHYAFQTRMWLGDTFTDRQLKTLPPVEWPLVRTHPGSGRKALWVGAHATHIVGRALGEGRILLADLLEHATQRQLVHRHSWRVGDLVMWDNRCVLHRGRRFDLSQPRELRRTTTEDRAASGRSSSSERSSS
jgi:alpha-ketoglutarate-dependent 2,4-dichlorophenoxyacetate dioxygenase